MRRIQFFEIADQSWCPRIVREGVTDYLQHAIDAGRVYAPAAPVLARVLRESGRDAIIDLAAGGGGPWQSLLPVLHAGGIHPTVTLTDWRPNTTAFQRTTTHTHGQVQGHVDPVDARAVPPTLHGARTMFSALHHFRETTYDACCAMRPMPVSRFSPSKPHIAVCVRCCSPVSRR